MQLRTPIVPTDSSKDTGSQDTGSQDTGSQDTGSQTSKPTDTTDDIASEFP